MTRKILQLVVIMALLACRQSKAQVFSHSNPTLEPDPAPQASDLTVDQLLARYTAARGGEQKLKSLSSVRMTGTQAANNGKPVPITVVIAPGRYLRQVAQGSDAAATLAVDGPSTWELNKAKGILKPTPMSAADAARFHRLANPQGPLVDAKAKGAKIEAIGKQPWRGSQVYKLKVTFSDGDVIYYYLDAKSFLPVRLVAGQYVPQLGKKIDLEVASQDFRDVDGVKFPFSETGNAPEANYNQKISWSKIEVNKPLDASTFKAPKG